MSSPTAAKPTTVRSPVPAATPTPTMTPAPTPRPFTLSVFAASTLSGAFNEIGRGFEAAHPTVQVVFNFAGARALRMQIEQGATPDVFASGDTSAMAALAAKHLVFPSQVFSKDPLAIIVQSSNPANLTGPQDLAKPGVRLVIGTNKLPVGKSAVQMFTRMNAAYGPDFSGKVLANVVANEPDVPQVVSNVGQGQADAGIVFASDAAAEPQLRTIPIPPNLNILSAFPIAPLAKSTQPQLASAFITYIFSADGQAILNKWGFVPAQ